MSTHNLTPETVRREVDGLLKYLADANLAYLTNQVIAQGTARQQSVTWRSWRGDQPLFTHGKHLTVTDYLNWVESGNFSAMLNDGSLLQITYIVADGDIINHRLVYVPSPFEVDHEILVERGLVEYLTTTPFSAETMYLRSPVRFDYDRAAASDAHPTSHLTVSGVDCRVPCRTWLPLDRFVRFVFQHYYPQILESHEHLRGLKTARSRSSGDRVPASFQDEIHVSWT